jgi:hypothetical protein
MKFTSLSIDSSEKAKQPWKKKQKKKHFIDLTSFKENPERHISMDLTSPTFLSFENQGVNNSKVPNFGIDSSDSSTSSFDNSNSLSSTSLISADKIQKLVDVTLKTIDDSFRGQKFNQIIVLKTEHNSLRAINADSFKHIGIPFNGTVYKITKESIGEGSFGKVFYLQDVNKKDWDGWILKVSQLNCNINPKTGKFRPHYDVDAYCNASYDQILTKYTNYDYESIIQHMMYSVDDKLFVDSLPYIYLVTDTYNKAQENLTDVARINQANKPKFVASIQKYAGISIDKSLQNSIASRKTPQSKTKVTAELIKTLTFYIILEFLPRYIEICKEVHFQHNDLHIGNITQSTTDKTLHIIDFGWASLKGDFDHTIKCYPNNEVYKSLFNANLHNSYLQNESVESLFLPATEFMRDNFADQIFSTQYMGDCILLCLTWMHVIYSLGRHNKPDKKRQRKDILEETIETAVDSLMKWMNTNFDFTKAMHWMFRSSYDNNEMKELEDEIYYELGTGYDQHTKTYTTMENYVSNISNFKNYKSMMKNIKNNKYKSDIVKFMYRNMLGYTNIETYEQVYAQFDFIIDEKKLDEFIQTVTMQTAPFWNILGMRYISYIPYFYKLLK